jgi:hypothetical protein
MTQFEFGSVLISIVLAFAMSEIITAWGRVIRHRSQLSISWPYALVSVWLGLTIILHWAGLWPYREGNFDRTLDLFILLAPALVVALACHVLNPELEGSHPAQLEEHYFRVSRWALPLCGSHMLLATTADSVVLGVTYGVPTIVFVVIAAVFVTLAFTKRWSLHVGVLSLLVAVNSAMLIFGRAE